MAKLLDLQENVTMSVQEAHLRKACLLTLNKRGNTLTTSSPLYSEEKNLLEVFTSRDC